MEKFLLIREDGIAKHWLIHGIFMTYPPYPRFRGVFEDRKPLICCSRKLTRFFKGQLLYDFELHMNVAGAPHFTDRPRHIFMDQHIR